MARPSLESFDYTTLTVPDRAAIHDALADTTVKHITAAPGLFERMDFDLAASPSQRLETVHLPDAPTDFKEIDDLAKFAGGESYTFMRDQARTQSWFFNSVRKLMQDGTHIFPVTPHGNIADIAFWQASWVQNIGQDDWQERNGLVISRGVTTIKAFDMAASEVVQKLGHVFLSFPRTETIDKLGEEFEARAARNEGPAIDFDLLISTNNKNMRGEVKKWMGIGLTHHIGHRAIGRAFHSSWSGKTDKVLWGDDHKPEAIELGHISKGTIDLVKHGLVLPVAAWYSPGTEPLLEVGEPTKVRNEAEARAVQEWQAERLAKHHGLSASAVTIEDRAAA